MAATTIIDKVPLDALIRYSGGSPKPPARLSHMNTHGHLHAA